MIRQDDLGFQISDDDEDDDGFKIEFVTCPACREEYDPNDDHDCPEGES